MLKRLFGILLTCPLILSGCTSSANTTPKSEPLDLPVAKVSAEYSEDAMKILKSFYDINAKELVSEEVLNAPVMKQEYDDSGDPTKEVECQTLSDWCYQPTVINPYFYQWGQGAKEIRNGKTMKYIFELADKEIDNFYGTAPNFYTILTQDGKTAIAEGSYDDSAGEYKGQVNGIFFRKHPTTSLFLDDELMKALKEEGFDITTTTADSCIIVGHSVGIYFSDGKIERYYPQAYSLDGIEEIMELNTFYTPEEFAYLLDEGETINTKNWRAGLK